MKERSEKKKIIDFIAVDEKLRKDVLDTKVVGGMLEGPYYYVVFDKKDG